MDKIQTIYDLIIYAYIRIHGNNENSIFLDFLKYQKINVDNTWNNIMLLFRELLHENLTIKEFVKELKKYDNDKKKFPLLCVNLLFEFDKAYKERQSYNIFNHNSLLKKVNTYDIYNNISEKFAFYPLPEKNFIINSNVVTKNPIRHHRNKLSLWEKIVSFSIVELREDFPPILIHYYNDDYLKNYINDNNKLKIAIVPISNKDWFDVIDEKDGSFTIEYNDKDKEDIINHSYEKLLLELDGQGVDIVVFPELAILNNTTNQIIKFLSYNCLVNKTRNLKLIFMGSRWFDKKNESILLSGSGKILLRNEKIVPAKITNEKGEELFEGIREWPEYINLIDIESIGRIYYLICKDGLENKSLSEIYYTYEVNVSIISAYSNSISDFEANAENFSKTCLGSTIFSNSCAIRKPHKENDNIDIGFISYPVRDLNTNKANNRKLVYKCSNDNSICAYCKCATTFDFILNSKDDNDNISSGVTVINEKIII